MNRSNTSASFDIVHVLLDMFFLGVAFLISEGLFGRDVNPTDWKAIASIYLVCSVIFLLANRTANIYNNTLFF